jgi:hypothetical protein
MVHPVLLQSDQTLQAEKIRLRHQKDLWVSNGRKGHAPSCTRVRSGRGLVEINRVPIGWSEQVILKCPGCGGLFQELD